MASFAASIVLAAVVTSAAAFFVPWEQATATSPAAPCIADDLTLMQAIGALTYEKALNDRVLADSEYVERHLRGTREDLLEVSQHQQVLLSYFADKAKACLISES